MTAAKAYDRLKELRENRLREGAAALEAAFATNGKKEADAGQVVNFTK